MTELRFDPGAGAIVATRAHLDTLATPESAPAALVAELEHAGMLVDGRPIDHLEALARTWSAPLATIDLRIRRAGRQLLVTGILDGDLAILLIPVSAGSDAHRVVAIRPASLPRQLARLAGLGLRAPHPRGTAPVPLSLATVAALGGANAYAALRADAHKLAAPLAVPASVDAVLATPATHWTLTIAGTMYLSEGTLDRRIDVLDPGPAGMWLIVSMPADASAAAAIPVSTAHVWALLGSVLALHPRTEVGTRH